MKKIIFLVLFSFLIVGSALSADQWSKSEPAGSRSVSDIDAYIATNNAALDRVIANYREGVKLVYNSVASLTVNSGEVVCSNSDGSVRRLRKNDSTLATSWAVGDNGLDAGSEASSTTYYVYAECDTDEVGFKVKVSTNSAAPSGVTYYKRLGYFTNDSSSNITAITNDNENSIVATGTITNGNTISLPSGYSQDECNWTVALGGGAISGSNPDGIYYTVTVNSSRVVTCTATSINAGGSASGTVTCNYIIACYR